MVNKTEQTTWQRGDAPGTNNDSDKNYNDTKTAPSEESPPPVPMILELSRTERREVARRTNISVAVVHETVREEGNRELQRSPKALALSALAAGLSMGFSLVGQGLLHSYLPDVIWRPLIENLGYSLGFLIVVLGRQQLFTENTLRAILPLLAHRRKKTFFKVIRLWTIVLAANLVGACIFAFIIARTALFPPDIQHSLLVVAMHSLRGDFMLTVLRGIFAGWLIALMVWLLPASEGSRLHIVIIITYIVALGGFAHIIAGSVDVLYLVNINAASWGTYWLGFMLPTLIGNIIGGVSLVAVINFAQVAAETSAPASN